MSPRRDWGWKEFYEKMISDCIRHALTCDEDKAEFWQGRLDHYKRESKFEIYKEK